MSGKKLGFGQLQGDKERETRGGGLELQFPSVVEGGVHWNATLQTARDTRALS